MTSVAVARQAMATRFEIVLHGENVVALRAAAEEALDEIERIESQLSLYRPTSEIARVNALAAHQPVRVAPGVFRLLERAQHLSTETGGAFDITIGPLMRAWGLMGGSGRVPDATMLAEARAKVGMHLVHLDAGNFTVQFARDGVMLDLGAIGKGYAIERAAECLREAGVTNAILHGGTSTIFALGHPPNLEAWNVALDYPPENPDEPPELLAVVPLRDEALSVSAVWGKSFQSDNKTYGHVIDPRTGQPATGASLAAVVIPAATDTDALSTALLTVGVEGFDRFVALRPAMRALALTAAEGTRPCHVRATGIEIRKMQAGQKPR